MKSTLLSIVMTLFLCSAGIAKELIYQGTWNTTNRKLDGVMTCVVTHTTSRELQGRFHGTWQGVPFDYTVLFTGPLSDLRTTATIDGAAYECRASISREEFRGAFNGDRYNGSFDLKRVDAPLVSRK